MATEDNVNTQVDELDENLNTDTLGDEVDNDKQLNSDSNVDNSNDVNDNEPNEEVDSEEDKDRITQEELDSMSDEEFEEYVNSKPLVKVVSKPKVDKEINKDTNEKPKEDNIQDKTDSKSKEDKSSKNDKETVNYEDVYKEIFKGFKANGKEIVPKTAEDVISLMQMGANYTKKMQLMAPMRKAVESLNRAEIGEQDLNFLIDVHKGDKEAIKKLLEKHKVDPVELDMETTNYVPKNNIVSDDDVEFHMTLDEISDSIPKIKEVMDTVWDSESKKQLLKDQRLMKALHEEIQMGRFDKVQAQLEVEKTFGRYKNMSDIDAYIDLVTKLVKEEQTKQQANTNVKNNNQKQVSTKPVPDKTKAAPVRSKQNNQGSSLSVKDLLSMPEEAFNKLSERDLV